MHHRPPIHGGALACGMHGVLDSTKIHSISSCLIPCGPFQLPQNIIKPYNIDTRCRYSCSSHRQSQTETAECMYAIRLNCIFNEGFSHCNSPLAWNVYASHRITVLFGRNLSELQWHGFRPHSAGVVTPNKIHEHTHYLYIANVRIFHSNQFIFNSILHVQMHQNE